MERYDFVVLSSTWYWFVCGSCTFSIGKHFLDTIPFCQFADNTIFADLEFA